MDNLNLKVTCIIPAYNEAKTIAGVVKTCLQTPEIGEIIVVSDGSKDKTNEKLKKLQNSKKLKGENEKLKIIRLSKNRGKGYAISRGVKAAKNELLLFLDADLINIKPYHLSSLIQPVMTGEVDMTIADLKTDFTKPSSLIWPFSGQRCLSKKQILPILKEISKTKYGIEVVLNEKFRKKRVVVIPFIANGKNLYVMKPKKENDWIMSYIKQTLEILQKSISMKSYRYQNQAKKKIINKLKKLLE